MARTFSQTRLALPATPACARRFNATLAEKPSSSTKVDDFSELEGKSSFATPEPTAKVAEEFAQGQVQRGWMDRLPGNR